MPGCFVAGTLVHTVDGLMPIEQLLDGGRVIGKRDDSTGPIGAHAVLDRMFGTARRLYHVTLVNGPRITATRNHPFFVVDKGWRSARELEPGDRLAASDGTAVIIAGIEREKLELPVRTYNLHVDEVHTFYVGDGLGVWVHNTKPGEPVLGDRLFWGLGASGPRQRLPDAGDPETGKLPSKGDPDGASAFESTSEATVKRGMGVRGAAGKGGNMGAISEGQLAAADLVAVPTPSTDALATEAGMQHYSIRPKSNPDPKVDLTPQEMADVKAKLEAMKPVAQAKPKDFGCG